MAHAQANVEAARLVGLRALQLDVDDESSLERTAAELGRLLHTDALFASRRPKDPRPRL